MDESVDGSAGASVIITGRISLDVMPEGQLAMEIGDCEAVVILTPKEARKLATRIRTTLGAHVDLIAERNRANEAIRYQRRKRDGFSSSRRRPTRSEQSLEGAAVNGLTPVGQEDEL